MDHESGLDHKTKAFSVVISGASAVLPSCVAHKSTKTALVALPH